MTDKELVNVLYYVDSIIFDTYSNAQKLTWQEIEVNCKECSVEINKILTNLTEKYLTDEELLKLHGWAVECLSPFEIRHEESGAFASLMAAQCVVDALREECIKRRT